MTGPFTDNAVRVTKWVQQEVFAQWSGYSLKAITKKRQRGVWLEGVHWKKADDGHIMINTVEFDKWVDDAAA